MCKTTPVFNIQEIAAPSYIYISLHEIVVSKFFFYMRLMVPMKILLWMKSLKTNTFALF